MEQSQNKTHKFWLFCYKEGEETANRQYLVESQEEPKEGKVCRFTYLKVICGSLPPGKVSMDSNEYEIQKVIGDKRDGSGNYFDLSQRAKDSIHNAAFTISLEFTLEKRGGIKFIPLGKATVV